MKRTKWMFAAALSFFVVTAGSAFAQGKGHGKGHNKHGDDDDQGEHYYRDRDRDIRGWYDEHQSNLPPGLQKRLEPVPEDLERRLPPPPPDCAHVLIGGHIVLMNRRTNIVVDIFHFEGR